MAVFRAILPSQTRSSPRARSTPLLLFLPLLWASFGVCQTSSPYLARIAHETSDEFTCVLLDSRGAFHYEQDDGSSTKVYEGELPTTQLTSVQQDLQLITSIPQSEIAEPLIKGAHDLLDIHYLKDGKWHRLAFRTRESQVAHKSAVKPLLQWMSELQKIATRQLSEDAGKRNCLPRGRLRLKTRDEVASMSGDHRPNARNTAGSNKPNVGTVSVSGGAPPKPLLQLSQATRTSDAVTERCLLVTEDGQYRWENQKQKIGSKQVLKFAAAGKTSADELASLHKLLNSPALTELKHHDPPGGEVPVMGNLLELSIARPSGEQNLVLTDSVHRSNFFYSGDADISVANGLLRFVKEHFETAATPVDANRLNGCAAP